MSLVCPGCDVVPSPGAPPGSACSACGATLVRDEPFSLDVVDLGERTGAPPLVTTPRPVPVEVPTEQFHPDTVNVAASDEKLELEGNWAQERAAKVAGKVAPSPLAARVIAEDRAARRHNAGLTFAIILVLAVAGAGAFLYIKASSDMKTDPPVTSPTKPKVTPPNTVPDRGITIRIIGKSGTPITIDGAAAGKAPVSLKRRSSTRDMVIGANGKLWTIVPDHDQTIDVSK